MMPVFSICLDPVIGGVDIWENMDQVWWPWDECEVMEGTTLKGKNVEEIYKGDIVATELSKRHTRGIVRIGRGEMDIEGYQYSYTKSYYGVYIDHLYGFMDSLLEGELYVLGNIYENEGIIEWDQELQEYKHHPDLLKGA